MEAHHATLEAEQSAAERRVAQRRRRGAEAVAVAVARTAAAQEGLADAEAALAALAAEALELRRCRGAAAERLAAELEATDVRTALAALEAGAAVEATRQRAEQAARSTFGDLAWRSQAAWARAREGGLKEAVQGVAACERDRGLRGVPKVAPRCFDLAEFPGGSKPRKGDARGFYADLGFNAEP